MRICFEKEREREKENLFTIEVGQKKLRETSTHCINCYVNTMLLDQTYARKEGIYLQGDVRENDCFEKDQVYVDESLARLIAIP